MVIHGRVVRKLEALFDRIVGAGGPEPVILPLDFARADASQFAKVGESLQAELGRLDGIVHCAATLQRLAPIEHHSLDDWTTVLRVNLTAAAQLTRAVFPLLREAPRASALFTLDTRGHEPRAYWSSYAASKAGLEALVRVLADEWEAAPNLAASGVIPGPLASPMRKRTHPGDDPALLLPPESLVPLYLSLLIDDPKATNGRIVDAQAWTGPVGAG